MVLLLTVSKMLFRQRVRGRIDHPLRLNPAGVSLFRMHAPQNPLQGGIGFRLRLESCHGLPWFCFAFNGFEDAVSAARLGTN